MRTRDRFYRIVSQEERNRTIKKSEFFRKYAEVLTYEIYRLDTDDVIEEYRKRKRR